MAILSRSTSRPSSRAAGFEFPCAFSVRRSARPWTTKAADRTIFIFSGQAGGPIPPPAPVPVTGTIQGVITEVILPRCVTGQALMTVEAADGEHEIRITADTVITRFDVGSGLGGSVGVPRRT